MGKPTNWSRAKRRPPQRDSDVAVLSRAAFGGPKERPAKADIRAKTNDAVADYLARGGSIRKV